MGIVYHTYISDEKGREKQLNPGQGRTDTKTIGQTALGFTVLVSIYLCWLARVCGDWFDVYVEFGGSFMHGVDVGCLCVIIWLSPHSA